MHLIDSSAIPTFASEGHGLTIGTFDGVHRGHLSLLHRLRAVTPSDRNIFVYTFINHPSHVLSHLPLVPFIYTWQHKCRILQESGVDYTIFTSFTKEFAQTAFDDFLIELKKKLNFSFLVLGANATFGRDKHGTEQAVRALGEKWNFQVEYLPKLYIYQEPVSSGRIRTLIEQARFDEVQHCLGRPYSIYAPMHRKNTHYHLQLFNLCLPPDGTYQVIVKLFENLYRAEAHIQRHWEWVQVDFLEAIPNAQNFYAEVIFH